MAFNQKTYINNYNKNTYKMYPFRVRKDDSIIINKLDTVNNINKYIRTLIDNDANPCVLTIKQIKERILPVLAKHNIREVYLFGSYARGEANRNSDVDIYCDGGDVDTLWKHSDLQDELIEALGKDVDVITIGSQMHDFFRQQLEEDMIKIC